MDYVSICATMEYSYIDSSSYTDSILCRKLEFIKYKLYLTQEKSNTCSYFTENLSLCDILTKGLSQRWHIPSIYFGTSKWSYGHKQVLSNMLIFQTDPLSCTGQQTL